LLFFFSYPFSYPRRLRRSFWPVPAIPRRTKYASNLFFVVLGLTFSQSVCLYCGSLTHSDAECLLKSKHREIRDKEAAEASSSRKSKVSLPPLVIDDPIEFPVRKVTRFFPLSAFSLTVRLPRLIPPMKRQLMSVARKRYVSFFCLLSHPQVSALLFRWIPSMLLR
jgi:hypothetical protein